MSGLICPPSHLFREHLPASGHPQEMAATPGSCALILPRLPVLSGPHLYSCANSNILNSPWEGQVLPQLPPLPCNSQISSKPCSHP